VERLQSGLKLRQLQIFREVLRSGSTRKAAVVIGMSQPAVSQQVKLLEAMVGFDLFERTSNRISPTKEAWELLRSVDEALSSIDRLDASIEQIRTQDKAVVSIAAPSVFGFVTLPNVVATLRSKLAVNIRILSGDDEQLKAAILSGAADIGIARLPLEPKLFAWAPIYTARNVCIFSPSHRFAARQRVEAEDLVGEPIIDIDPRVATHQMNINALRFRGNEPDVAVEYDSLSHEVGFVASGLGVAITNSFLAREYAHFNIESRIFEPSAVYHYVVFWQKDRELPQACSVAIDVIANDAVLARAGIRGLILAGDIEMKRGRRESR
jgi:DNA-binding transcriptional LysR family regulator